MFNKCNINMNMISEDYNYLIQEGGNDFEDLQLTKLDLDNSGFVDNNSNNNLNDEIINTEALSKFNEPEGGEAEEGNESGAEPEGGEGDGEEPEGVEGAEGAGEEPNENDNNYDLNSDEFSQLGGKGINSDIDFEKYEHLINDNPLINKANIYKKVDKYVKMYNDDNYQDYKKGYLTKKIYSKLNKKHKLVRKNNHLYLIKNNDDDNKFLFKLKLPKYLFINEYEKELDEKIKNKKTELDKIFNKLRGEKKRNPKDLKYFEECKKDYINLLEEIEFVKLYYIIVNKLSIENIKKISYSIQDYNMEKNINLYEKKHLIFNQEDIDEINEKKINKLNLYNELLENLKNPKNHKKINDEITDYIKQYDILNENINNDLKTVIKRIKDESNKQQFLIDYIVLELPKMY